MNESWRQLLSTTSARWSGDDLLDFSQPGEELAAAATGACASPLTDLAVIEVAGNDAQAFLQNQLTNELRDLADGSSRLAGYCSPKGRMLALFRVLRSGAAFQLCLPRELAAPISKRLQMYVLRSKVTLRDISEERLVLGTVGLEPADLGFAQAAGLAPDQGAVADDVTIIRVRGERPRHLWLSTPEGMRALLGRFKEYRLAGPMVWRWQDVRAGLPQVFATTQEAFVPQMANLDLIGGVSFTKGCYPGQEIVARMHYLGNLKRRMYRIALSGEQVPSPGAELRGIDGKLAGELVMAAPGPAGDCEGLAVLQLEMALDTPLQLDGRDVRVEPPPYPLSAQ